MVFLTGQFKLRPRPIPTNIPTPSNGNALLCNNYVTVASFKECIFLTPFSVMSFKLLGHQNRNTNLERRTVGRNIKKKRKKENAGAIQIDEVFVV